LFRAPQGELTDRWFDAQDVLGRWIADVHDLLRTSRTPFHMADHVDTALLRTLDRALAAHPVETAAATLIARTGNSDVAALAAAQQVSIRQLERVFLTQVGVAPTLLGRISRFTGALEMKSSAPHLPWADVAAAAGYYDQMHLVRDSHRFGGAAPSVLAKSWINCRADGVLGRASHPY
jgi:transcriptional regulator GlxA family with amidase domain